MRYSNSQTSRKINQSLKPIIMKHITVIFIFVLFSSVLFAQQKEDVVYLKNGSVIKGQITEMIPDKHVKIETGGGSLFVYTFDKIEKIEKQEIPSPPTVNKIKRTTTTTTSPTNFDNLFYWRVGYSSPSWKQFGSTEADFEGFNKSGVMAEMGKIYMLKSIPLPENMAIGINVDFISFYWNRFSSNSNNTNVDIGTLRADSKVGPSFTISPKENLAFDVYVKANINWIAATAIVYDIEDFDLDDEGYGKVGTIGFSTGFNMRYNKLMVGFEFNTISPKLEDVDNDGHYLGNDNTGSDKSPLPCYNFTIGMAF